jgi:hypothetical protein
MFGNAAAPRASPALDLHRMTFLKFPLMGDNDGAQFLRRREATATGKLPKFALAEIDEMITELR